MRIRVFVSLEFQLTGGDLLEVGQAVTWRVIPPRASERERVLAWDGAEVEAGRVVSLSRATMYQDYETFDPADPAFGPEVTGRVVGLLGVWSASSLRPGDTEIRGFDIARSEVRPVSGMTDEVERGAFDGYVITVELPDDTALPDSDAVTPEVR